MSDGNIARVDTASAPHASFATKPSSNRIHSKRIPEERQTRRVTAAQGRQVEPGRLIELLGA